MNVVDWDLIRFYDTRSAVPVIILALLLVLLSIGLAEWVDGRTGHLFLLIMLISAVFVLSVDRIPAEAEAIKMRGWYSLRADLDHVKGTRRLLFISFFGMYLLTYHTLMGRGDRAEDLLLVLDLLAHLFVVMWALLEVRHLLRCENDVAIMSDRGHVSMALAVSRALRSEGYTLMVRPGHGDPEWRRCSFNIPETARVDVYRFVGYSASSVIRISCHPAAPKDLRYDIAKIIDRELEVLRRGGGDYEPKPAELDPEPFPPEKTPPRIYLTGPQSPTVTRVVALDEKTIRMIAAGEVVERPASVVKELVENSIDADAGTITVEVEEGGRKLIKVTDDGVGMSGEDTLLSVERHTTSKVGGPDDLKGISTLGFRGEALASIGAVSLLEVASRSEEDERATTIRVEGAKVVNTGTTGRPVGTTVSVQRIFFNVPARMKHMSHARAELVRVIDTVMREAIANPSIHFKLVSSGQEVLNAPATEDKRTNIGHICGVDLAKDLVPVSAEGEVRITGLVARPSVERASSKLQHFIVNGRWVRSRELSDALREAYRPRTMFGRFPPAFLHIDIPPEDVDVNIHPQKTEVRFFRDDVAGVLTKAVQRALQHEFPIPEMAAAVAEESVPYEPESAETTLSDWEKGAPKPAPPPVKGSGARPPPSPAKDPGKGRWKAALGTKPLAEPGEREFVGKHLPPLRILGQARAEFIVAEGPDGVYLIDQHAAAERINLERLQSREFGVQELIEPAFIHLDRRDLETLKDNLEHFEELGYQIEEFGTGVLVRAVPVLFRMPDPARSLRSILEDIQERKRGVKTTVLEGVLESMACHASIKAGDPMTMDQMADLVSALDRLENPEVCAHGRPTMIKLPFQYMEKKFGRLG